MGLETKLPLTPYFWKTLLLCIKTLKPWLKYQTYWFFSVYWCRARALFQKVKLKNIFSNWGIASCFIILTWLGYKATWLDLTELMGCYEYADECVGQFSCDCDKVEGRSQLLKPEMYSVCFLVWGIWHVVITCKACCFYMLVFFNKTTCCIHMGQRAICPWQTF